jgi:hypothetical protein
MGKKYSLIALFLIGSLHAQSGDARAANGANFVLYTHHTEEAGERKIMLMNDVGQEADGTSYVAQMVMLELGITDRWTSEVMIEGQNTSGRGGYSFTGFRWENRYRFFEYGAVPLNPVIYVEYEDLSDDTKYLMEVSGRADAPTPAKARPRERVLETRLILGEDFMDLLDVSFNWLNETDLDTGDTAFGYAAGFNYSLSAPPDKKHGESIVLGIELFGGLGNDRQGITADGSITEHYLSPNILIRLRNGWKLKVGGAVGLTDVSQDIFRLGLGHAF